MLITAASWYVELLPAVPKFLSTTTHFPGNGYNSEFEIFEKKKSLKIGNPNLHKAPKQFYEDHIQDKFETFNCYLYQ